MNEPFKFLFSPAAEPLESSADNPQDVDWGYEETEENTLSL